MTLKTSFFWMKMGVLLGLTRTHARSICGSRVYDLKPFYRGAKITVVGAISLKKVVGIMTLDGSMDGKAFSVFIEHFLVPNLWKGAVVVMDNLPAHKLAGIEPLTETETAPLSSIYHPILRTLIR
ncbi:transposase [Microcoleus sp. Pol7_A1]